MSDALEPLVDKYIKLRDAKAKAVKQFKEKMASVDVVLTRMEGTLLKQLNELGIESARAKSGTAYKSTRVSATVADWDQTLDFIKENGAWQMLERRVSKDAVQQYREVHDDLPPGVNWREEVVVNVRRS